MSKDTEHAGHRLARLEAVIADELRSILRDEVTDPELHDIGIGEVSLSVDYRHARVHYALPPRAGGGGRAPAEVVRALARATPFLRARLAEAVDLKRAPDLGFVFDGFAERSP